MNRTAFVCLTLVALVLTLYWQTTGFGYVDFDDAEYVRDNVMVRAGLTAANIAWAFRTDFFANWHPLTWLSYMLDATLWGVQQPGWFHLTNILLHTINAVLLYRVMRAMTGAEWRSAL